MSSTSRALHWVCMNLFATGLATMHAGCYRADDREGDAGVAVDAARDRDAEGVDAQRPSREALLAFVDEDAIEFVTSEGVLEARVPYAGATVVPFSSQGALMGGVTEMGNQLVPFVVGADGTLARSASTSQLFDRTASYITGSAFNRSDFAFGLSTGGRRPLGGELRAAGFAPWPGECVPLGTSAAFGGELLVGCWQMLGFSLSVSRGGALSGLDLGGAQVSAWNSRFDISVLSLSRAGMADTVLLRGAGELISLGAHEVVAESSTEVVLRLDDHCLRRVDKRTAGATDVCREAVIRSAAVSEEGELFVVEGDDARNLIRVRDNALLVAPVWSQRTDVVIAGNTLALRSVAAMNPPAGFDGERLSCVWLVDTQTLALMFSLEADVLPATRLSRSGANALFVTPGNPIHAMWIELRAFRRHDIFARRPSDEPYGNFAFFDGPDVVLPQ